MADVTPPVGLAAYAASAISRADPIKTGVQAFWYEIRTAILPIVFIFNSELLLIGVKNFWHGLMIFIVSLIAIFSFTSAAQGWFLQKLRWYETLILLLITICMFRPDFIMNKIYPEYMPFEDSLTQEVDFESERKIRLHVVRHTNYGDRYKMFAFQINPDSKVNILKTLGLELEKNEQGNLDVTNLDYNGRAEKNGIDFYDEVTRVEINSLDRPAKEYVYIFGLFLLGFVVFSQYGRYKKQKAT